MFYSLLKLIFKIALRIFFRHIETKNKHLIPQEGPILIVANHPNTFMDPIAIASVINSEVYFIAKSTVFSTPFTKWLLQKMNLIPVYRREDGNVTGQANDDTFRKCYDFLAGKGTLLIFPEGTSFNERRLRPIKSGAARIALGTENILDFKAGVKIVPVGLNYSDATRFQSTLFINIGAPIEVGDFRQDFETDSYKAAQTLTDIIKTRLEELIVITETSEEDELVKQIEAIYKTDLSTHLRLTNQQADRLLLTKGIIEGIRYFYRNDPERVQDLKSKVAAYQQSLEKYGLKDRYVKPGARTTEWATNAFYTFVYLILGFPIYIYGVLTNYIPYTIPAKIADKLTEEQEFRAPIMMSAGIFTFPVWYVLLIYGFYSVFKVTGLTSIFALSLPVAGFFALQYFYRLTETQGYLRFLRIFYNKKVIVKSLLQQRQVIIQTLEEAKTIYLATLEIPSVK